MIEKRIVKMKKIDEIDVKIIKMVESSGNEMFFTQLIRNDPDTGILSKNAVLDNSCWQTKNLSRDECLSRVWFDASFLARFVGLNSMDDIILINLNEEEIKVLKNSLSVFRN